MAAKKKSKKACCASKEGEAKTCASKEGEKKACCAKKATTEKNIKVEITNTNGKAKATVTTSENGAAQTQVFEGSLEEVKAKVEALK